MDGLHDHVGEEPVLEKTKKPLLFASVAVGVFCLFFVGAIGVYGQSYQTRVLPGVRVGTVPVGGMTHDELTLFLQTLIDKLSLNGIPFRYTHDGRTEEFVATATVVPDEAIVPIVSIDIEKEVDRLLSWGKGNPVWTGVSTLYSSATDPTLSLSSVVVNEDELAAQVRDHFGSFEKKGADANIIVDSFTGGHAIYHVTDAATGVSFDLEKASADIHSAWSHLEFPLVTLSTTVVPPTVTKDDVAMVEKNLDRLLGSGSISLTFVDPYTKQNRTWEIAPTLFSQWVQVQKEAGNVSLGISRDDLSNFLDTHVAPGIESPALDAKFAIGPNGKVKEFQGARPGVAINRELMYTKINQLVRDRAAGATSSQQPVALETTIVEPQIKTGEVNDLGITDMLGIGYSNFSGSPTNRIKNVRFAVEKKLNGTLVKPGDTFSLLAILGPFTEEAGYLPELVIKGNEIKPEVAGGLCQVGSTMFRAAMNAGLPIVERRNHSLVVNYYNDSRNNKPGTDATIYDPAPDFKFKNDTGHYLLITTEMNVQTGDLSFTIWGTSDGRKGSYTPPVVDQWIPVGPEIHTKTTKIPVGKSQCQAAHPGAVTHFVYTIVRPDGTSIDRVFESHYRALPKICLEGATQEEIDGLTVPPIVPEGEAGETIDTPPVEVPIVP